MASPAFAPKPAAATKLDELLRTGQVRRAARDPGDVESGSNQRPLSSGVAELDSLLGGGLFRGEICEVVAKVSAGGTSIIRAALRAATAAGELCALIDLADAFDPRGAAEAGIDLRRILWVRPTSLAQALRASELLLEARLGLVVLDLGEWATQRPVSPRRIPREGGARPGAEIELVRLDRKVERVGPSPWARLSRRVERSKGVLLVLSRTAQAGSFAAATIESERRPSRWTGAPDSAGRLLRATGASARVARARHAPPSGNLGLQLALG